MEKTRFPVTSVVLSKRLGWRLVELEKGRQVRLDEFLKQLPRSKQYQNPEEVLKEIGRMIRT
jgi:hypothetical protein